MCCCRSDLDKRCIEFEANVPFTTIDADYVMDGKFLVLPLKGKGKCNMNLSKFLFFILMEDFPLCFSSHNNKSRVLHKKRGNII